MINEKEIITVMDVDLGHLSKPLANDMKNAYEAGEIELSEEDADEKLGDILEKYQNPVFVCDTESRETAEPILKEEFKDYPIIELATATTFGDSGVKKIMKQIDYCDRGLNAVPVDVIVAIGDLTIRELSKTVALLYDIPYVCIPTDKKQ